MRFRGQKTNFNTIQTKYAMSKVTQVYNVILY